MTPFWGGRGRGGGLLMSPTGYMCQRHANVMQARQKRAELSAKAGYTFRMMESPMHIPSMEETVLPVRAV